MNQSSSCPDETTLRGFVASELESGAAHSIREHLAACPSCTAKIKKWEQEQASDASGGDLVKGADTVHAAKSKTHRPETADTEQLDFELFDRSLLSPSRDSSCLGRIGKYNVLRMVGHGGMGVVLRAFDTALSRPVAIKMLMPELSTSATARRRFTREAQAAAAIKHPNVVTIYDVDEHDGQPYLVMEYIDGPTLHRRIRAKAPLELAEILRLSQQIATGLAAAHLQGVIHRDIKPGNIMLEDGVDRVKIADFGLARVAMDNADLTSQGRTIGTPAYMSPEQVCGKTIDARADLFSLGCVMYAMVSGRSPFRGSHSIEAARKVADHEPQPLHEIDPNVPRFFSDIVAKLLKKNPQERYQSAAEVADLLTRHLAQVNQTRSDQSGGKLWDQNASANGKASRLLVVVGVLAAVLVIAGALPFFLPSKGGDLAGANGASGAGGPVAPEDGSSDNADTDHTPVVHTVSRAGGSSDFSSVNEAFASARTGDTVKITDAGRYHVDTILLNDKTRQNGIRVEGGGATLIANSDQAAVFEVLDVDGVEIRAVNIEGPGNANCIAIGGAVGELVMENVAIRQSAPEAAGIHVSASEGSAASIVVRNCRIANENALGQAIWLSMDAPGRVELVDNRLACPSTIVLLAGACSRLVVRGNVFHEGVNAVNFQQLPNDWIEITNNTFLDSKHWLGFIGEPQVTASGMVANNLIVASTRVQGKETLWNEARQKWTMSHNWSTIAASSADDNVAQWHQELAAAIGKVTPRSEAAFHSETPGEAGYLAPVAGSPLLTSGMGGEHPVYVGAIGPDADRSEPD